MDNLDNIDLLTEKTSKLSSMLMVISGCGFETFDTHNETIKNNYLWACASLAKEVEELSIGMATDGTVL